MATHLQKPPLSTTTTNNKPNQQTKQEDSLFLPVSPSLAQFHLWKETENLAPGQWSRKPGHTFASLLSFQPPSQSAGNCFAQILGIGLY